MLTDFHIHTRNSDGTDSIDKIINKISHLTQEEVYISIVDHHSITFSQIQKNDNITIIPGVEISSEMDNEGVHLLAYGKEIHLTEKLNKIFDKSNEGYNLRAKKIYKELKEKGYPMPNYSKLRIQGDAKSQVVYLNDLAEGLKQASKLDTVQEVKKWAKKNGNLLFTQEYKYLPTTKEAINALKEAGLKVIVAHPGRKIAVENQEGKDKLLWYIKQLHALGIDGLEVFHPNHTKFQVEILREYAQKNALLVSAGTDYHGLGRGVELLSMNMEEEYKNKFLNAIL